MAELEAGEPEEADVARWTNLHMGIDAAQVAQLEALLSRPTTIEVDALLPMEFVSLPRGRRGRGR